MKFEIKERDLMARIGMLETRRGTIETPYMFPVINPSKLVISPKEIMDEFSLNAIITNAYFIKKNFYEEAIEKGLHELLNFSGPIMTDSGAYQILMYGDIEVSSKEIIEVQEKIGSDIAVILDIPTGSWPKKEEGRKLIDITISRAKESIELRSDQSILWVAPVQGGTVLELVEYSARAMNALPFDIIAIGSQTPLMMNYHYKEITDIIMTVKRNVDPSKPIHLFGAGHPMVFPLMVALGCDLFDSAAYALFAQDDRYITPNGTIRLDNLKETICNCPICRKYSPDELRALPKPEREKLLAKHNLYVSILELKNIKQAIYDGQLWEYLHMRMRSHPQLLFAFKNLENFSSEIIKYDPITKKRAIFYSGPEDVFRPARIAYFNKLNAYVPASDTSILLLAYQPEHRLNKSEKFSIFYDLVEQYPYILSKIHMAWLSQFFGIIPFEILDTYPLSQHEIPHLLDTTVIQDSIAKLIHYIQQKNYSNIIVFTNSSDPFISTIIQKIKHTLNISTHILNSKNDLFQLLKKLGVLNGETKA